MAKPDPGEYQDDADHRKKHWVKHAITLLLFAALVVTGTAAYFTRQEWWDMYMRLTH